MDACVQAMAVTATTYIRIEILSSTRNTTTKASLVRHLLLHCPYTRSPPPLKNIRKKLQKAHEHPKPSCREVKNVLSKATARKPSVT